MSEQQNKENPQVQLNPARKVTPRKDYSFIFVHIQSDKGGELDAQTKTVPVGQAGDGNATLLANKHDILITSLPLEYSYVDYWTNVLHLSVGQRWSPKKFDTDLLRSTCNEAADLVKFIKDKQQEGLVRKKLILSVFEADESQLELLKTLQDAGLGNDLSSECNYDLLDIGNKDGFRRFCHEHKITQLPGGSFKSFEEVNKFVEEQRNQGHTVVIKAPRGIGGYGQIRLKPRLPDEEEETDEWKETVKTWIKTQGGVEAEQFANSAESEHVVDVYIDPTDQHHTAVMFDQMVRNDNESAGMMYYGAKYPSSNVKAMETIMSQVESDVAPALVKVGYRGPAGIDVLWNPLHFMELNMRTDAITYVKHLTDRIGFKLYNKEPGTVAFMSLVNLPLKASFTEVLEKHRHGALAKQEDGIFALSSPNRQRWGFYDVVAVSPHSVEVAEKVMKRALEAIWGTEQMTSFLQAIYHPHAQIVPVLTGPLPYIVTLPTRYYDKKLATRKWPVILFLHGMGQRGTDLMQVREHGIPKKTLQDPHFQFVGVCPQISESEEVWDVDKLTEILDAVEKDWHIDTNREYVTGMSMGGHGTWAIALKHPKRFAAIAPICGDAHEDVEGMKALSHLPVWAFHGKDDDVVPHSESEKMVEVLKNTGSETVKLTSYEGVNHDSWTETYENPELYNWLLSHHL